MKIIFSIIVATAIIITNSLYAQDSYFFRYQMDANEKYLSAENTNNKDPSAIFGLSQLRKHIYGTTYVSCVANNEYLQSQLILDEFLKGRSVTYDTNDIKNYDFNFNASLRDEKLVFDSTGLDKIVHLYNKRTNIGYDVVNDTIDIKSVRKTKFKKSEFEKTNDTQTIKGWHCYKWIPKDNDMANKVAIWVSKEIPKEISMGLLYNPFENGIVKIEWINGRFDILMEYKKLDTAYNFNYKVLPFNNTVTVKQIDFFRSALIENDSMDVIKIYKK